MSRSPEVVGGTRGRRIEHRHGEHSAHTGAGDRHWSRRLGRKSQRSEGPGSRRAIATGVPVHAGSGIPSAWGRSWSAPGCSWSVPRRDASDSDGFPDPANTPWRSIAAGRWFRPTVETRFTSCRARHPAVRPARRHRLVCRRAAIRGCRDGRPTNACASAVRPASGTGAPVPRRGGSRPARMPDRVEEAAPRSRIRTIAPPAHAPSNSTVPFRLHSGNRPVRAHPPVVRPRDRSNAGRERTRTRPGARARRYRRNRLERDQWFDTPIGPMPGPGSERCFPFRTSTCSIHACRSSSARYDSHFHSAARRAYIAIRPPSPEASLSDPRSTTHAAGVTAESTSGSIRARPRAACGDGGALERAGRPLHRNPHQRHEPSPPWSLAARRLR
jgi:hypothetical protein